jgi:5-methylcytosine-specific restriction protein B
MKLVPISVAANAASWARSLSSLSVCLVIGSDQFSLDIQTTEEVLDRIVMQKVLPRLHGSRRRLELPLLALAQFCRDLPEVIETDEKLRVLQVDELGSSEIKLPTSYSKLRRMLSNLRANQFVSFAE